MTINTVDLAFEQAIEAQTMAQNMYFARLLTRLMAVAILGLMVMFLLMWFFAQQYTQFLIFGVLLAPPLVAFLMFNYFERRGQLRTGVYIFILAFMFMVFASPVFLPVIMPAIGLGYLMIVILANQFLGDNAGRWMLGGSVIAFVLDIIMVERVATDWFIPLSPNLAIIIGIISTVIPLFTGGIMMRLIILGQARQFRAEQIANNRVEKQAEGQAQQNSALQNVIKQYRDFTNLIGAGDLSARLEISGDDAGDVIASLGKNLNDMAASLHKSAEREQQAKRKLEDAVSAYVEFVQAVAGGNLSMRLDLDTGSQNSEDDLLRLGLTLNVMVDNLRTITVRIRDMVTRTGQVISETLDAAKQQSISTSEQDVTLTETVATVEEVRLTVEQTAERALAVTEASNASVEASRAGQHAVQESIAGMRAIQQRVEDIATNILSLSERTQQIGEIIETVNNLADQSKLLALNASIEAARAGEEGKGFAVVAMEVRQLAEQSREATARVRDILSEIQQATNAAVMVTEEGSKVAESGTMMVERAGHTISDLARALEDAAALSTQIAASTQQQIGGMDQLMVSIQHIKDATTQTVAGTNQTQASMRNLIEVVDQLDLAVAGYQLNGIR